MIWAMALVTLLKLAFACLLCWCVIWVFKNQNSK